MGPPPDAKPRPDGRPQTPSRKVHVEDFYIGKYPVTAQEFCDFLNDRGNPDYRYFPWNRQDVRYSANIVLDADSGHYHPRGGGACVPVVCATWFGAAEYCKWLSARTGRTYRLPTEAEWEYAARGPEGRKYPWGSESPLGRHENPLLHQAALVSSFDLPSDWSTDPGRAREFGLPVGSPGSTCATIGSFPASSTPQGVADMADWGWEWCSDIYDEGRPPAWWRGDAEASPELQAYLEAPVRVVRGGLGFYTWTGLCSVYALSPAWVRRWARPFPTGPEYGVRLWIRFRVVVEPSPGSPGK